MSGSRSQGGLVLVPATVDPANLTDGQIWYRSDTQEVRNRINGKTVPQMISPDWPLVLANLWYWKPVHGVNTTIAVTQSRMYGIPMVVPRKVTLEDVAVSVTTAAASSSVRLGLYDDSSGLPGARLADFGTVSSTTTGVKVLTITGGTEPVLTPGWVYWLAVVAQGGAPTLRQRNSNDPLVADGGANPADIVVSANYVSSVTGALPTPFGTPAGQTGGPAVACRFSG